jgi:hypothetical protein
MAIKRKLSDMLVPRPDEAVRIHVPASNPEEDLIRGSEAFTNTVAELVRERNHLRELNEQLNRKCVFLAKVNDRIEGELDRCRKQTNEYIRRNGKLVGILSGARASIDSCYDEALAAQRLADEITPAAPQPVAVYDNQGMPLDASPEPITLEELESLSTVLARTE